jgi:hypothetical protein
MKYALIAALLGVGAYAIWKHQHSAVAKQTALFNSNVVTGNSEPAGVPLYSQILAPNRADQLSAWATSVPESTVDGTYAPAFGSMENQPDDLGFAL